MNTLTINNMPPAIAIHLATALLALVIGPAAIWARRTNSTKATNAAITTTRAKLHRAAGYAWITCMVIASISALFIRGSGLPNIAGFSPIHILVPVTLGSLVVAFCALARGDIRTHKATMVRTYIGACIVAGAFTLLPGRFLGRMFWG